jgi:hypothetical protein
VKLTAFNVYDGKVHDTTKIITIQPTPSIQIDGEWETMVCSNNGETNYCLEDVAGQSYQWSASPQSQYFELISSTVNSSCLAVNWKRNTGIQPVEIILTCKVTSSFGCSNTITKNFLLLPDAVPATASIERKDDTNILLCVFDVPTVGDQQISGSYLYQWGFYQKANPNNLTLLPLTDQAYQQFQTFNPDQNIYFVDVFNTTFSYCKTRIEWEGDSKSVLQSSVTHDLIEIINVYPNPVNGHEYLNVDLIKHFDESVQVELSILNNIGSKILALPAQLSDKLSHLSIPLNNLDNGYYFIEIRINSEVRVVRKFVVHN